MEDLTLKSVGLLLVVLCLAKVSVADFREDALNLHNVLRVRHGSPPLSQKKELNTYAQNYAQELADYDKFEHSRGKYGENLYYFSGTSSKNDSGVAVDAINSWYDESLKYRYSNPGFSFQTGHFTAIVWKNTKYLGIGLARRGITIYVVASYDPSGNFLGEFEENVLPPNLTSSNSSIDPNCDPINYLQWITKNDSVPTGFSPLFGGIDSEGEVQEVCSASHSGDLVPGKLVAGNCYVSYGGMEFKYENAYRYAVSRKLDGCPTLTWLTSPTTFDFGVPGGISASGELIYVARCPVPEFGLDVIMPGQVRANDTAKAYYSLSGKEHSCLNYELLVLS